MVVYLLVTIILKGRIAVVEIWFCIIHTRTLLTFVHTLIHISSFSTGHGTVSHYISLLRTFRNTWGQLFGYCSDWGCDNWHLVPMGHGYYIF